MYNLEYCDDPISGKLFNGYCSFEDTFSDEYQSHLLAFD